MREQGVTKRTSRASKFPRPGVCRLRSLRTVTITMGSSVTQWIRLRPSERSLNEQRFAQVESVRQHQYDHYLES
jgi:hypothetical protein